MMKEVYDGEISDYLLRARKWINWAEERGAVSLKEDCSLDDARNLAQIGIAHVLLAAVIMLVKESP